MPQVCTGRSRLQPVAADISARPPSPQLRRPCDQLTAADLALADRMRAAMCDATDAVLPTLAGPGRGPTYWRIAARRKEEGPRPLDAVGMDLIVLANHGATEAALLAIPAALQALIRDLFPSSVRRTLEELDVEEAELEAREDVLHARRRAGQESPALLREEAEVNRAEARVQEERARVLEAAARQLEARRPVPVSREPETRTADHEGRPSMHFTNDCAEGAALQRRPAPKVALPPHARTPASAVADVTGVAATRATAPRSARSPRALP